MNGCEMAPAAANNAGTKVQHIAASAYIAALIDERERWEAGSFKSAMDELYGLLARCVGLYEVMTRDDADGNRLRDELDNYAKAQEFKFNGKTHTVVKIVRAVFANDKSRYTSYGNALKIAIGKGVLSKDLVNFLRNNGGIDGTIKSTSTTGSVGSLQTRAEQVWWVLKEKALAAVKSDALTRMTDQAAIGKRVVLLATQMADGEYKIHDVVKSTVVVNTAFASVFDEGTHGKVVVEVTKAVTKSLEDRDAARNALLQAMAS